MSVLTNTMMIISIIMSILIIAIIIVNIFSHTNKNYVRHIDTFKLNSSLNN